MYTDGKKQRTYVAQFQNAIKKLAAGASEKLQAAQRRYKHDFDKKARPLTHAQTGDWVYITREQPTRVGDRPRRHKIQPKAMGPFEVLSSTMYTVTILRDDGTIEKIARDRTTRAPETSSGREISEPTHDNSAPDSHHEQKISTEGTAIRTREDEREEPQWHAVKKIVKYNPSRDTFTIRWEGYGPEDDSEEPPSHIRYNMIVRFFKSKKQRMPPHLRQVRERIQPLRQ